MLKWLIGNCLKRGFAHCIRALLQHARRKWGNSARKSVPGPMFEFGSAKDESGLPITTLRHDEYCTEEISALHFIHFEANWKSESTLICKFTFLCRKKSLPTRGYRGQYLFKIVCNVNLGFSLIHWVKTYKCHEVNTEGLLDTSTEVGPELAN